jgi:dipeptidyl aminopeptidase/acylaminoacyl peptidase
MRPKLRSAAPLAALAVLAAGILPAGAFTPVSTPVENPELDATILRMARIGYCGSPSLSPDGRRIAFVSSLSGVPQVWVVPTEGGWPEAVTALDDQVTGVDWSPGGEWLAFGVAPGGGMNQQIYLVHPDGDGPQRLTAGGKDNNWLGRWSHDGRSLAFASNVAGPAMDAYTWDLDTWKPRLVARNPGIGDIVDRSRDGRWATVSRVKSRGDSDLVLVEMASGHETPLTPHTPPAEFSGGIFSPDGRTVYLSTDADRDLAAFARIRLDAGGRPGPIEVVASRPDAELESFEVTEDGSAAALMWNVAGKSELAFLDLATAKAAPGPALPAEVAGGMSFSRDGKLLALALSGSTHPSDIWVFDRAAGSFRQVTRSPHAGVNMESLVTPELVHFKGEDGLPLSGWLYLPRHAPSPGPFVLSFHGGPEAQERPSFHSDYQALLARGIGVFAPNVRGSAGFGRRFVNLDNGALRVGAVQDIKAAADFLVAGRLADPRRLGIMGGSYGGYMTMAGLTEYPDLFAAGADLFGVVNFETFFAHTEPWMAAVSTVEYGDPKTQLALLRSLSPIHKLDRVRAPTIVLHGANDTNVPVVEAEQVVEALKKRGVPVEYVLFPDEGHGFRKVPNRIRATVETVKWFARYLGPGARAAAR